MTHQIVSNQHPRSIPGHLGLMPLIVIVFFCIFDIYLSTSTTFQSRSFRLITHALYCNWE